MNTNKSFKKDLNNESTKSYNLEKTSQKKKNSKVNIYFKF